MFMSAPLLLRLQSSVTLFTNAAVEPQRRRSFDIDFKERVLECCGALWGASCKHFNIDPKRIQYWKKQKMDLAAANKNRARVSGGGRKKVSEELDTKLAEWIHSMRDTRNRVSRKMIQMIRGSGNLPYSA